MTSQSRRIHGTGTSARRWRQWDGLDAIARVPADKLLRAGRRLVVVAPHPDDEVLAAGGLIANAAAMGLPVCVILATNGEASHPGSGRWGRRRLTTARPRESQAALRRLGACAGSGHRLRRLGYADGTLSRHEPSLQRRLGRILLETDIVLTTWRYDGHPDHEAVGRAVVAASQARGATCFECLVWAWHWATPGDARIPWHQALNVPLPARTHRRKRHAVRAFRSQIMADDSTGRAAILPGWARARVTRNREVILPACNDTDHPPGAVEPIGTRNAAVSHCDIATRDSGKFHGVGSPHVSHAEARHAG